MTNKPISPFASDGNGQPLTMSSREIAELCEKRHDHVIRDIEKMLQDVAAPSFGVSDFLSSYKDATGRSLKEYRLPKDLTVTLITGYRADLRYKVIKRLEELEDEATRVGRFLSFPDFTNPVAAARAWADQFEARQLAERTKAEIGTRREATAMNTASQALKRAIRLEVELDRARSYATVKRMSLLHHGQEFNWRLLKRISEEEGNPPIDVFDANYGTVKAYHAEVWQAAYALVIPERDEDAADAIMPKRVVAQA